MALPAILALGQAGLSVLGSRSAAKRAEAQYAFQRRLQAINSRIANEQANRAISQIRQRQIQERAALAQQTIDISDRAREALATSTVEAGASGTAGASLAALLDDFERQELNSQQALLRSQQFRDQAAEAQAAQVRTNQEAAGLNSLPDPLQRPSVLETIGNAANAAFQTYIAAGGEFRSPSRNPSTGAPQIPTAPQPSPIGDFTFNGGASLA